MESLGGEGIESGNEVQVVQVNENQVYEELFDRTGKKGMDWGNNVARSRKEIIQSLNQTFTCRNHGYSRTSETLEVLRHQLRVTRDSAGDLMTLLNPNDMIGKVKSAVVAITERTERYFYAGETII